MDDSKYIYYVPKSELQAAGGKKYLVELEGLQKEGLIVSFEEVVKVVVDRDKLTALESILEFEEIKRVTIVSPIKPKRQE